MAITGNKGEWSEIYTLFRLLGEGKVHAGDANLNKLDLYYPILDIIREESKRFEYKPDTQRNIVVIDEDGNEYAQIPMDKFMTESKTLLDTIKESNQRAFSVPGAECFMSKIGCTKLKAPSKDKADIHIIIHDLRTNMTPLLGFSIKSQLGSASTLLNPGIPTNITYRVVGGDMTNQELDEINSIDDHLPRMKALLDKGYHLDPKKTEIVWDDDWHYIGDNTAEQQTYKAEIKQFMDSFEVAEVVLEKSKLMYESTAFAYKYLI